MPNPIKYTTGSETLALKKGNFYIGTGDVGKGPTNVTGYYNGITPPSGGYTIYLNKATGGPSIYTASNDAQLISLTNSIAQTSYTTANECLVYFAGQTDMLCVNRDYDGIVTNGLIVLYDSSFTPSYPKSGTTVYNNRGTINATLLNDVGFSNNAFQFDGTNDYISLGSDYAYSIGNRNGSIECIIKPSRLGVTLIAGAEGFRRRLISLNSNGTISYSFYNAFRTFGVSVNITGVTYQVNNTYIFTMTISSNNTTTFYLNGTQVAQLVPPFGGDNDGNFKVTTTSSTYDFPIGYIGGLQGAFQGEYYKATIYNRGLSDSEVLQNYNSQKDKFGL